MIIKMEIDLSDQCDILTAISFLQKLAVDVKPENVEKKIEISEMGFDVRAENCLKSGGIYYLDDLLTESEGTLRAVPNLGRKSIENIKQVLASFGVSLRG